MKKPDGCVGCPFWQDGDGFVPDADIGSTITIWGQNPGAHEVLGQRFEGWHDMMEVWADSPVMPFLGKAGRMLRHMLLPMAGLHDTNVNLANAIRCRWQNTDSLPSITSSIVRHAIDHCRVHDRVSAKTRYHVALGDYAVYYLTGLNGKGVMDNWRGWVVPFGRSPQPSSVWTPVPPVVFITYHPAAIFRDRSLAPVAQFDFQKFGKVLAGTWPTPFPAIHHGGPMDLVCLTGYDTEFDSKSKRLRMWSWAQGSTVGISYDAVPALVYPVGHNLSADWPYLPMPPARWDDTMMMHASLYGGFPHDLNYVGSFYARTNRWKHLYDVHPEQYSAGDALGTLDAYTSLACQLAADDGARFIYECTLRPLIPILVRQRPIRIHQTRIKEVIAVMQADMAECTQMAQAWAGWPLNLASPLHIEQELSPVRKSPVT